MRYWPLRARRRSRNRNWALICVESLKSKTGCRRVKFFLYPHINRSVVLLFKDSISEAASPNQCCSQRDLNTLRSRQSEPRPRQTIFAGFSADRRLTRSYAALVPQQEARLSCANGWRDRFHIQKAVQGTGRGRSRVRICVCRWYLAQESAHQGDA